MLSDEGLRHQLSEGALAWAATLTWDATALGVLTPLAREAMKQRNRQPGSASA